MNYTNDIPLLKRNGWILSLAWTLILLFSFFWNLHQESQGIHYLALNSLKQSFEKDVVYRRWASEHGGVYVTVSEHTQPNPYLSHLPERDIVTPSGLFLTLINPAYMTRQVHELGKEQYGIRGNITSLKPLRPENIADSWEKQALKSFSEGSQEAVIVMEIDGNPYMRLMKPFYTEESCLKCHGHQGFELGDVRGGISLSLPMSSYIAHIKSRQNILLAGHGIIWVAGLFFIWIMTTRIISFRQAGEAERKLMEKERLEMQRKLLDSHRLESLGVLAGGIAHDFNNLLSAIIGNLDLSLLKLPPGADAKECIENAIKSSMQAAELTCQMLAYAGKGHSCISDVHINEIVEQNTHVLKHSISNKVIIQLNLAGDIPHISADKRQIHKIIMNILTNALEAIGGNHGKITITTAVNDCDEQYFENSHVEEKPVPGKYVIIKVSDTGCGMDENIKKRLFDPFFTTKFTGRGLGMAAVIGMVKSHKGAIFVDTQPSQGTVVRVAFPAAGKKAETQLKK